MGVGSAALPGSLSPLYHWDLLLQYVETVTSRQSEIQKFIAEGCKEALLEEKRRFCFLVDKHCGFADLIHRYHLQVGVRQGLPPRAPASRPSLLPQGPFVNLTEMQG